MPSLRRSLILYFLVLLGLALTGVGLLIDRFASDTLAARLESSKRRIVHETDNAIGKVKTEFDQRMLRQARELAREYRDRMWGLIQLRGPRSTERYNETFNAAMLTMPLGDLSNGWSVATTVALTHQTSPTQPSPTRATLWFLYFTSLYRELAERIRTEFQVSSEHPDFYQLQYPPRDSHDWSTIRSPRQPFDMAPDFEPIVSNDGPDHIFRDDYYPEVGMVRRVLYRSQFILPTRPPFFGGFGGPPPARPDRTDRTDRPDGPDRPGRGDRPDRSDRPRPPNGPAHLYVQIAHRQSELESVVSGLQEQSDEQIRSTSEEAHEALHRLRYRIAAIGVVTFLAVLVGGWVLIGVGLSPLRKLSDAVSQVNEKDFRLPIQKELLSSELVPIHDRLTHSLDALRRAFEREKEAIADISHELRTPVAGMLATMDVALRKPRSAEQYKETLTECRVIAKQLGQLVERVMSLAYLDAGTTPHNPIPVDIAEVVESCAAVIRPLATAHGLTLTTSCPPEVEFTTDPDRIREVLMNLLHNAIEYNQPSGTIELRARRDATGLHLEVADTGIGMSPEVKEKIFDRFFRADSSRTATGVHAGLGLAIVKESVNRLGGTITVESTPGLGSTFHVHLPG